MSRQTYKLVLLPLFEKDLIEITDYIINVLKNPGAAHRLIDDVESAILKRLEMPLAFAPYKSLKLRKYEYYRISVRKFSIFYVVIDDIMEVRRIIYSRRNIDDLLSWFFV